MFQGSRIRPTPLQQCILDLVLSDVKVVLRCANALSFPGRRSLLSRHVVYSLPLALLLRTVLRLGAVARGKSIFLTYPGGCIKPYLPGVFSLYPPDRQSLGPDHHSTMHFSLLLCALYGLLAGSAVAQSKFTPTRPPALPLAVKSPYLSTWFRAGKDGGNGGYLPGQWPTFWT
jgi:hypothetical protein